MIANLFGLVEGKRHDCAKLAISELLQTLQRFSHGPNREKYYAFSEILHIPLGGTC